MHRKHTDKIGFSNIEWFVGGLYPGITKENNFSEGDFYQVPHSQR
jgi:hypothetical protein